MGTLGRPKAEVLEAMQELGYGSFGLHGWRYPVRTKHRAALNPSRRGTPRPRSSALARDSEIAVATAIGMAAIGATAALVGFITRELRPSRAGAAAGLLFSAVGLAALMVFGLQGTAPRRR